MADEPRPSFTATSPLIAVTGATGFVGRQVLRSLLRRGQRVRAVVRAGRADSEAATIEGIDLFEVDDLFEASHAELARALDGVDTLVHVAWYAEPGRYLDSATNLDCLSGTLRLARAFADLGGRRFVGVGTCFEYDLGAGLLRTDTPLRPATLYAACKASTYQVLTHLLPSRGVEFAWCRLFYLFGEGEDPRRLVPYVRARLQAGEVAELTSGTQVRDYLDVVEAGDTIAGVALGELTGALNICSGEPVTVRALVERIARELNCVDLLRFGVKSPPNTDPPFVVGVRERLPPRGPSLS